MISIMDSISYQFCQSRPLGNMSYCPCQLLRYTDNHNSKPILAFCVMIFTFPQSYYISQLLTIDHDCQVPVDKHGSVKKFTPPL